MATDQLPALPEPKTLSRGDEDGAIQLGYTADQMRAYALAAIAADRARAVQPADLSIQAAGEREQVTGIGAKVESWLGANCVGDIPRPHIAALVAIARASLSTPASGEGK